MSKTIIIAEAGVNHNGSLSIAKKLIDVASKLMQTMLNFKLLKLKKLYPNLQKKLNTRSKI